MYPYLLEGNQLTCLPFGQAVMKTHVNLVDMHECARMGVKSKANATVKVLKMFITKDGKFYPRQYATVEKLRAYTIDTEKFYPLQRAYATPLLRYLLREILNEYNGKR